MISSAAVLAPLLVEVALTLALGIWAAWLRVGAVVRREVEPREVALRQQAWPPKVAKVTNAYQNQLELPVLFYVVLILALLTASASTAIVVLAWIFVLTRLAHAVIHVTTNDLTRRFATFAAGGIVLALMWLLFAAKLLFGP